MPELPEVETVKRGLVKLVIGKTIDAVTFDWPKGFPNAQTDVDSFLVNSTITDVHRRAKVLLINLSTNHTLVVHLKMTGQLVYRGEQNFGAGHPNDSLIGKLPDKSTRVILVFTDGSTLFFNDQRKFGWMRLLPTSEVSNIDFMKKLGPEPLNADFTQKLFLEKLMKRPNTTIKAVLLDQSVIAGVGNIYSDESLWAAKIYPATLVKKVPNTKLKALFTELCAVLQLSIEKGGSTDRNYVNVEGKKGSYISFAKVFRKEGQPCQRCGDTIIKIRVAGRGTHLCPSCQVLNK